MSRLVLKSLSIGAASILVALVLFASKPADAARTHAAPALKIVSVSGYPLVITGSGWHASQRVIFTVTELSTTEGIQIKTNRKGSFTVGLRNVNMCAQPLFVAGVPGKPQARIHVTWLQCAIPTSVPTPQITVLKGTAAQHNTYTIVGLEPRSVKMQVGDELYIWESGTDRPSWRPHADPSYLQLLRQGTTPPRMCPQVECDAGFYWDYVAIQAGVTGVGMSASCRDFNPPCMVPDLSIDVHISPASTAPHR